jgi:hypothetical protein
MRQMPDEILNSDALTCYLTAANNVVKVTTVHSLARCSAGFGGSNALHGHVLALLGETVGTQLPKNEYEREPPLLLNNSFWGIFSFSVSK